MSSVALQKCSYKKTNRTGILYQIRERVRKLILVFRSQDLVTVDHVFVGFTPVARSNLLAKRVSILRIFPGILVSGFHFPVFIFRGCGEDAAIFNQPIFPTNISTALFEKKSERRSPRGLFVCLYGCKLPRIWRENPLKSVVSISRDYWVYFDIAWTSSKYSECYF